MSIRGLLAGLLVAAAALSVAEPVLAHRIRERVFDPVTGQSFRRNVPHRHGRHGRVILLDPVTTSVVRPYSVYGAPYRSSSYDPYYRSGYRSYGYRRFSDW